MLPTASLITDAATGAGLFAGSIAVFGFLAQIGPTISGAEEAVVRRAAVVGGVVGLVVDLGVIVLSAGFW